MERVWAVLTETENYGQWWGAATLRVDPAGPARPGQTVQARGRALGRTWPVSVRVLGVDAPRRTLDLETVLPLGITVRNHIVCTPLGASRCRLSFG